MGKVAVNEVESVLREAEKQSASVTFRRKCQPSIIYQIATYGDDQEFSAIAKAAMAKKLSTPEGQAFLNYCTPSRVATICRTAISSLRGDKNV